MSSFVIDMYYSMLKLSIICLHPPLDRGFLEDRDSVLFYLCGTRAFCTAWHVAEVQFMLDV